MAENSSHAMQSQARRRTTYGLNVAVAVVAAIVLTVLVNVLVYRKAWKLDLSAGRKYTLSKQTLNLLHDLDQEHQIVTLFGEGEYAGRDITQQLQAARDLVDEYARYSSRITAEHINVTVDPQRHQTFLASLHERYAEKLSPAREAIEQAQRAVEAVRADITNHLGPLKQALDHPQFTNANAKKLIQDVSGIFASLAPNLEQMQNAINEAMSQTLPNYSGARSNLANNLTTLATNVYGIAIERFERIARSGDAPADVREILFASIESFKRTMEQMQEAINHLQSAKTDSSYDRMRVDIMQPDPIVLVGPREVRVLGLADMFRPPPPQQTGNEAETEPEFQGEERLTGALVSMTLENPPLVVFVSDSAVMPLSSRGVDPLMLYTDVAQRLRNMNFEVAEWSPAGGRNFMGQVAAPAGPPPTPKPGQKAVWVVLPASPPNPNNPAAVNYRDQIAAHIKVRLESGDSALLVLGYSNMAQFGQTDPVADLLSPYGVTAQLDRVILQEIIVPNRPPIPNPQFIIDTWSGDLPIAAAINGMPATFFQASPLVVGKPQRENVRTHVLARLTANGERMWAETDVSSSDVKFKEANKADAFDIAAAIDAGEHRVVVVSDPVFASDYLTTNADARLSRAGVGLASYFGAAYPANAELFINSVYWLSDLESLIAASARTQDIRRINIKPESVPWLRRTLMAGMPLGTLALGLAVWVARRRE